MLVLQKWNSKPLRQYTNDRNGRRIAGGFAEYIAFPKEITDKGCFNAIPNDIDPIDTVIAETASSVLCAQINTNIVMDDLSCGDRCWDDRLSS